jgi:hypothetical protein
MRITLNLLIRHSIGTIDGIHPSGSFLHYLRTYTLVVVFCKDTAGTLSASGEPPSYLYLQFVLFSTRHKQDGGNMPYIEMGMNQHLKN